MWEALVDDDPLCYECLLGLGSAADLAGDAEQAEQAWRAAAALARDGDTRAADALAPRRERELEPVTDGTAIRWNRTRR